jgi:hypothetical protein
MASSKTHDISIKVGEYTRADGTIGFRTRSIGKLMRNEQGNPYIIINADALSTQLFALARKKGEDTIFLNCWEPDKDNQQQQKPRPPAAADDEDGIPY